MIYFEDFIYEIKEPVGKYCKYKIKKNENL